MKTVKIGRNPDNDIVVSDETRTVSGYHAVLKIYANGTLTICDNSTNGTFINGSKANKNVEVLVMKGDRILLGPHAELDWTKINVPAAEFDATEIDTDEKSSYTIGTAPDNRIVISDSTNHVSRHHAILTLKTNGSFYIYDQSTNGTYVNGVKISAKVECPVKPGDSISFANIHKFDWSLVSAGSIPNHTNYPPDLKPQ
jgi:pSer/pThr/pTyr-binding forkhead associated (FHA) protein